MKGCETEPAVNRSCPRRLESPADGQTALSPQVLKDLARWPCHSFDLATSLPIVLRSTNFSLYNKLRYIDFVFFLCSLQMREIEWESSGFLLHDRRCDVACFIYDSTDPTSFTQVVQLREVM